MLQAREVAVRDDGLELRCAGSARGSCQHVRVVVELAVALAVVAGVGRRRRGPCPRTAHLRPSASCRVGRSGFVSQSYVSSGAAPHVVVALVHHRRGPARRRRGCRCGCSRRTSRSRSRALAGPCWDRSHRCSKCVSQKASTSDRCRSGLYSLVRTLPDRRAASAQRSASGRSPEVHRHARRVSTATRGCS
jgi:hypothetical protein